MLSSSFYGGGRVILGRFRWPDSKFWGFNMSRPDVVGFRESAGLRIFGVYIGKEVLQQGLLQKHLVGRNVAGSTFTLVNQTQEVDKRAAHTHDVVFPSSFLSVSTRISRLYVSR